MAEQQERLEFGTLDLIPLYEGGPYTISVLSEDATFGQASEVTVQIRTLLTDGALSKTVSHDPRSAYFKIEVEGMDSATLAEGEMALVEQIEKPNTLTWTPPDGEGAPCVFEVIDSHLDPIFDDFDETNNIRVYGLRLTCMPFTRAQNPTVVDAVVSVGAVVTTQVDACTSTSGWTGSGPVTTTGGVVYASGVGTAKPAPNGGVNNGRFMERAGTVSMVGTPYLTVVSSRPLPHTNGKFQAYILGGQELKVVAQTAGVVGGNLVVSTTFYCPATSFDKIRFTDTFTPPSSSPQTAPLGIADITKTSVAPFTGTARQKSMTIDIGGSARTQGSLAIAGATGLGEVLCYVRDSADGSSYQPSLRIRRTGGAVTPTPDAATVSGFRENIGNPVSFSIPISDFPRGGYSFIGLFRPTSAPLRTITWTAKCSLGGPTETGSATVTGLPALPGVSQLWQMVHMGVLRSGRTLKVPDNSTATMDFTLTADSGLEFDDAWLFNERLGQLTWLDASDRKRVWLDSPTTDLPEESIYRGNLADRSDAHYPPVIKSWGRNQFRPGKIKVDTVCSALDAAVSLSYYKRFRTHVVA